MGYRKVRRLHASLIHGVEQSGNAVWHAPLCLKFGRDALDGPRESTQHLALVTIIQFIDARPRDSSAIRNRFSDHVSLRMTLRIEFPQNCSRRVSAPRDMLWFLVTHTFDVVDGLKAGSNTQRRRVLDQVRWFEKKEPTPSRLEVLVNQLVAGTNDRPSICPVPPIFFRVCGHKHQVDPTLTTLKKQLMPDEIVP